MMTASPQDVTGESWDARLPADIDPHFSWSSCDICRRSIAGNRYDATALIEDQGLIEVSICTDCVYYNEYGRLDDETMTQLETVICVA